MSLILLLIIFAFSIIIFLSAWIMLRSLGSAEKKEHMEKIDNIGSDLSKLLAQQRHGVTQSQPANLERKLDEVSKNSKDIIQYSEDIPEDLSLLKVKDFIKEMNTVATESYRVLKKDKFCAVLMGDTLVLE